MGFIANIGIVWCCLYISYVDSNSETVLDVAAFNVQVFGVKKMSQPVVNTYLPKVILRYDLILIQEIRDSSGQAIINLMGLVKALDERYEYVISGRLGRSTSKEQYAYIYRRDWLTLVSSYVYKDSDDVFEREPFVARFQSRKAAISDFVAIGIHTKPDDAPAEISNLVKVYDDAVVKTGMKNAIVMGDFNAGCDYVSSYDNIKLATDSRFYWAINNHADSTTKGTDCPYDRIVLAGPQLLNNVVLGSAGVFDFATKYGLNETEMLKFSDHYPLQIQFKSKYLSTNMLEKRGREVSDEIIDSKLSATDVYNLKKIAETKGYQVETEYKKGGAYLNVHVSDESTGNRERALELLRKMKNDFPKYISSPQEDLFGSWIGSLDKNLQRGNGDFQTMYDWVNKKDKILTVTLSCSLQDRSNPKCFVRIEENI